VAVFPLGRVAGAVGKWFPTFFDAFLPLLIFELFIPPLFGFVGFGLNYNCNNGLYWRQ